MIFLFLSLLSVPLMARENNNEKRKLDNRTHITYEGWKRIVPTHIKAQYAGGMGFISLGAGWDYGRKRQGETDILIGFITKAFADASHLTLTLKQNYIPWSIRCSKQFAIEPFCCGLYFCLITGENFWIKEPSRYPIKRYYGFPTQLRTHLYIGQRFTFIPHKCNMLKSVSLFYELNSNELDLIAKFGNKKLKVKDIINFSVGIKFRIMK